MFAHGHYRVVSDFLSSVCMYIRWTCLITCVQVHMCEYMWRSEDNSVIPQALSSLSQIRHFTSLELVREPRLAGQWVLVIHMSLHHQYWDYKYTPLSLTFVLGSEGQTKVLVVNLENAFPVNSSPKSQLHFFSSITLRGPTLFLT